MTRQLDVDRALEEWLAEGPSQLPDRAIDGIVRQLIETDQRRPTWLPGRQRMNRMLLAVGGLAAVVALTFVGAALFLGLNSGAPGVGGAPPSPSPTSPPSPTIAPTAAPADTSGVLFTSERYDYSLLLPDESWTVDELPGQWVLGQTFSQEGEGSDSVFRAEDSPRPYIVFNSQRVPAGTTLEEWVADHEAAKRLWFPTCGVRSTGAGVVDGETAVIHSYVCGAVEPATEAVWLHGSRGYALRVFWPEGNLTQDPRSTLDEWLPRFQFTN
jgi:hypothetical protein